MIEKTVYDYLNGKLTEPVYLTAPNNLPSEYVLIEKTGSSCENHIHSATFTMQSYSSESLYKAASLNQKVIEAMEDIIADATADVSRCNLNSDYNYTDTTTKKYRYQAVFDLTY